MVSRTKANLRDSEALVEFQNSLEFFSGSVERLMDAVLDYLSDVKMEMERHIAILENTLKEAKEKESCAKAEKDAAYEAWQRVKLAQLSTPSPSEDSEANQRLNQMEIEAQNAYYLASKQYDQCVASFRRAESDLDEGKRILNAFYQCYDDYSADYNILFSPGGDALMRYVAKNGVRESISHLQRILEVVSMYSSCSMSLSDKGNSSEQTGNFQRPGKRVMELRREEAMDDVAFEMRRERSNGNLNPNTIVRCKVCGRPFAICRCKPSILPEVK